MIVGLTGGIGTGKSTVAGIFKHLGVPVINADEIAHHLVDTDKSVFDVILKKFGNEVINQQQKINRATLRAKIFNVPQDKIWLEQLLHPLIKNEIVVRVQNLTYPYCIVEIPLLIEAGMQDIVDRILTVDCPQDVQLLRAKERGQHTEAEIRAFIANQITREARLAETDDLIENVGDIPALIDRVLHLHQLYLSLAS